MQKWLEAASIKSKVILDSAVGSVNIKTVKLVVS